MAATIHPIHGSTAIAVCDVPDCDAEPSRLLWQLRAGCLHEVSALIVCDAHADAALRDRSGRSLAPSACARCGVVSHHHQVVGL